MPKLQIKTADQMRDFIETARVDQGLTFRALAQTCGYAHAGYWTWIKKEGARITLDNALASCDALGIKVELSK